MLRKGCVKDLKSGRVARELGYVAVCMCRYPRGLPKSVIDTYSHELAPTQELLDEFHAERKRLDNHNAAFLSMNYQKKFVLTPTAVEQLRDLAECAKSGDVFVVCQCEMKERCHRELLLIAAKRWFGAATELRAFSYPDFEARLGDVPGEIQS